MACAGSSRARTQGGRVAALLARLRTTRGAACAAASVVAVVAVGAFPLAASAQAAGPKWKLDSISNTAAAPGETFEYIVEARNVGDQDMNGTEIALTATLPAGLKAASGELALEGKNSSEALPGTAAVTCAAGDGSALPSATDPRHVRCVDFTPLPTAEHAGGASYQRLRLHVEVEAGTPAGVLTPSFEVSGGGAAFSASAIDPTLISAEPLGFGVDAFDNQYLKANGEADTRAAAHPADLLTSFDFNSHFEPLPLGGTATQVEPFKDASVQLPPGFAGNPTVVPHPCTTLQLTGTPHSLAPECLPSSQVGTALIRFNGHALSPSFRGPFPLSYKL